MNIYQKINNVKLDILNSKISKSGKNKFSGFDYYELSDFTPTIINSCNKNKLFTKFNYFQEKMVLEIINCEKPEEKVEYQTTTKELQLKGCNEIQALGGTQTYLRRYLFLMAFDIVEPDNFDANVGNGEFNSKKEIDYKELFPASTELITDFNVLLEKVKTSKSLKQLTWLCKNHKVELTDEQKTELNNVVATIKLNLK